MTKFLSAAVALCALAGAAHAQSAKPPCAAVDFTTKAADIGALNSVIDIAVSSGLLAQNIPEPIAVANAVVAVVPFKVLNLNFDLTPTIKELKVGGISTVLPQHLVVSSPNSLQLGANFSGSVSVKGTISVSIQQLDLKWYSICWTDAIHAPFTCPPAVFDVEVNLVVNKPAVSADTTLNLVGCAANVPNTVCADVTVTDILVAALTQKFDTLLARLLRRFQSASVKSLAIAWDSISALDITIGKSGSFINTLLNKLLDFSVTEVNKKGDVYKIVVDVVQKIFKAIINKLFSETLGPQFGNTCYDP